MFTINDIIRSDWIALDQRLSNDAHHIWMCAFAWWNPTSFDAGDVVLQPLPCTVLGCYAGGCHQGVMVEAPRKMCHAQFGFLIPFKSAGKFGRATVICQWVQDRRIAIVA